MGLGATRGNPSVSVMPGYSSAHSVSAVLCPSSSLCPLEPGVVMGYIHRARRPPQCIPSVSPRCVPVSLCILSVSLETVIMVMAARHILQCNSLSTLQRHPVARSEPLLTVRSPG